MFLTGVTAQAQLQPLFPFTKAKTADKPVDPAKEDAKFLADAKLTADDPVGLVKYFRTRTLSEEDLTKIKAVIQRMGDEDFEVRVKASKEAEAFKIAAIGPLRHAAISDPDPEVQYRALETLRRIENVSHAMVAAAATRALVKLKHAEATGVLLGFLPMADSVMVEDEIRIGLKTLAIQNQKADAVLVEGLKNPNAVRRAAAASALIEASFEQNALQDEVRALVVPMLKSEKDSEGKFRVAFLYATKGRNPDAVMSLVETMPDLSRGRIWQVEDILLQLAGSKTPKVKLGPDRTALEKGRDDWLKWMKETLKPEDYAAFNYQPKTEGKLHLLMLDQNGYMAKIVELGPDLRQRWKVSGIYAPADFEFLPNGKLEYFESNYSRMTEVDLKTGARTQKQLPASQPLSMQRLDNGHLLVATRNAVMEYDAAMKQVSAWGRNNGDVLYAGKRRSGPVVVLVQNSPNLLRLDDKFKELPDPVKTGQPTYQAKMELLPNDRVLITEQEKVAEYDLKQKDPKPVWQFAVQNCTCVQRLPNGSTLIVDSNSRTVKEVAEDKTTLWQYTAPDSQQVMRAYRR
jgi:hypothetical protein